MNTIDIGNGLELHVRDTLNTGESIAYLWSQIPGKHLVLAGLIPSTDVLRKNQLALKNDPEKAKNLTIDDCNNLFRDVGVDILQIIGNTYIYIQCKCYSGSIGVETLGPFFFRLHCNPSKLGKVYYTGTLNGTVQMMLSQFVATTVECINLTDSYKTNLPQPAVPLLENVIQPPIVKPKKGKKVKKPVQPTNQYILRDYQQQAVTDCNEYFKTNVRGILAFPSGCGKTITSYFATIGYKHVIILSPFQAHADQNLQRFKEYSGFNETFAYIPIHTNGYRDVGEIKQLIKNKKRVILSSTYDSVDIIRILIKKFKNYIVVVDEFHNLSAKNLGIIEDNKEYEEINHMHNVITTANKILFVSATPRAYSVEGIDDVEFNKNMFGNTIASMTVKEAIERKCITNYEIYVPSINEDNETLFADVKKEINVDMVGNVIMAKCMFLLKGILYNRTSKIIVYCNSVDEIAEFQTSFTKMNEYYGHNIKYPKQLIAKKSFENSQMIHAFH
jgi:predicted helicase